MKELLVTSLDSLMRELKKRKQEYEDMTPEKKAEFDRMTNQAFEHYMKVSKQPFRF